MNVAIHNPSSVEMSASNFAVPHGKYRVNVFNKTSKKYEEASAVANCWEDYNTDTNATFQACTMKVNHLTKPREINLFKLV